MDPAQSFGYRSLGACHIRPRGICRRCRTSDWMVVEARINVIEVRGARQFAEHLHFGIGVQQRQKQRPVINLVDEAGIEG